MGLDLSSFEAFKKQATGGSSSGSVGSSGGGSYSSNPVHGNGSSSNSLSIFEKEKAEKEEEEKKVANAYEKLFEEVTEAYFETIKAIEEFAGSATVIV